MAKPDMPYGLFPWQIPSATTPAGALTGSLADMMRWYWRVRTWTSYLSASFSVTCNMSDGSTIHAAMGLSALETWDVLASGLDELSLVQCEQVYLGPAPYQWIRRGYPTVSGTLTITDSLGGSYPPGTPTFTGEDTRTLFARNVGPDSPYHATRDPVTGLFTPFLGPAIQKSLWFGSGWGVLDIAVPSGGFIELAASTGATPPPWSGGGITTGHYALPLVCSLDGHSFTGSAYANWAAEGGTDEGGSRLVESVDYSGDGAISLVIAPAAASGYWTYAPRIDPSHPTYDADTGAIANNPATGAPWTIQEIIARHGP